MLKRLFISLFILFGITSSSSANCNTCNEGLQGLQNQRFKLLREYPGTAATIAGCVATCSVQEPDDQLACFTLLCGGACFAIGFGNCYEVGTRLFSIEQSAKRVKNYCRQQSCPIN